MGCDVVAADADHRDTARLIIVSDTGKFGSDMLYVGTVICT